MTADDFRRDTEEACHAAITQLAQAAQFLSGTTSSIAVGHSIASLEVLQAVLWAEEALAEFWQGVGPEARAAAIRHVWGREPEPMTIMA